MICSHCHTDNVEEANYCKLCGKPYLHRSEEIEKAKQKVTSQQGVRRIGMVLGIIFGIIYILIEVLPELLSR